MATKNLTPDLIPHSIDRGLPSNVDAERLVLGSVMAGFANFADVAASVSMDDFATEAHRWIFNRMAGMWERGESIDRVTVHNELIRCRELESCGGIGYLIGLDDGLPQLPKLDSYCGIIRDKSILRRTIFACQGIINDCVVNGEATEVLERAESMLAKISDSRQGRVTLMRPAEIKLNAPGGINGFMEPKSMQRRVVPLPWAQLTEIVPGFRPGQSIVLAARPGVGKSVALAQIVSFAALCKFPTALFSLEMSREEILVRMTCARASVSCARFQAGVLTGGERALFREASAALDDLPMWIDDTTACTVPAAHAAIRKLNAAGQRIALIVIDYLQLMESGGRHENRVAAVSEITRGIKRMGRELDVPVLTACQLNRASIHDGGRPQLHHLRESGSIEQDADIVIFLHQPKQDDQIDGVRTSAIETEMIVAKQRNGPVGIARLIFQRGFTRFDDPQNEETPECA